jgi:hypothetical protein
MAYEALDDADDLRARLARPENDFRKTLSREARMIDTRITYILIMQLTNQARGLLCPYFAASVRAQQLFYPIQIHLIDLPF